MPPAKADQGLLCGALFFSIRKNLGRAVSRILSARVAPRRGSFICCDLTRSPDRFRSRDGPSHGPLFGLAPDGVYRAASLALGAVGSYPTFSPLPRPKPWRFVFCGTFRQSSSRINCPRVPSAEPRLHGIVSCGVRTFLPRRINAESDPPPFQGERIIEGNGRGLKPPQASCRGCSKGCGRNSGST